MTMETELRKDVLKTFADMQKALSDLKITLNKDQKLPAWFQAPSDLPLNQYEDPRDQAFALIGQLEYLEEQKPREILVGAGLIACSKETLKSVEYLNSCKEKFKQAILALKNARISLHDEFLNQEFEYLLNQKEPHAHPLMKKMGVQRLHLKQCYRKIPTLPQRPDKVSWTWANTRAITRITVAEAEQMLLRQRNNPNVSWQLSRLQALNPNENLAIVQELAPHLRANVVIPEDGRIKRIMVKGPVPLFYLSSDQSPLPQIKPPKEKQRKNEKRKLRSDVKIDPEPFLPAIRAHRYLS